jgi:radical SAM enzyme (TIGR01210 family)
LGESEGKNSIGPSEVAGKDQRVTNQIDYPEAPAARTRWIEAMRTNAPPKNALNPREPYAFLEETEIGPSGESIPTATVFLTNRECPYRCLMCDLWTNTLDSTVPRGAIAAQIRHALERLPSFRTDSPWPRTTAQIKLYNAGSFFDPGAIPPEDYREIASEIAGFGRTIVECHPAFVGKRTLQFQKMLGGKLEVAIGLETVHAETLDRLNKRFTLDDFSRAARFLRENSIDLRVFLLLRPPFMSELEGLHWAKRSLEAAFDVDASVCCVIPTRGGNGAMERLAGQGLFAPPRLSSLEEAVEYGIRLKRGRVLADLWDVERLHTCSCSPARAQRLDTVNRTQTVPPPIVCERRCAGE